ncbi:Transcriptional regulatory protein ResD [Candidatus Sulfobium mesophilum]|uniref:Phosphate regulon transcriptional regulatory protein PhoB n=1 Tax=Candidatus Sulfobium mesophilum TaxID=2016548 RepID=A0A2U3QJI6_9BACT|nr:Transcriptional regulatory protein ResD [Candidatus Sulfobium mesophilum]
MDTGQRESILIIEDEKKISEIVRAYLEKEGYRVKQAETGGQALKFLKETVDLVVLDLMLPDIQGEDLCRIIRESSDVPVIILTAKSGEEDRIKGLGIGADDYVVKPFSPRELVARVKAQLRRAGRTKKKLLSYNAGALRIDVSNREVFRDGMVVILTPTEYKILLSLAEQPGWVFSREQLVTFAQGFDFEGYDRTIDAHVKNLRHKIEKDSREPEFIKTVYGVGYKFTGIPDAD